MGGSTVVKQIPWAELGAGGLLTCVILVLVFGFILKWKSAKSNGSVASRGMLPSNVALDHEGRISSNTTGIELTRTWLEGMDKKNEKAHKEIKDTMDTAILEIRKINGG